MLTDSEGHTTQRPNDPTTQRPNHPTTQRPNDPTTQRPNDPTTQRPNDPTTQRPNDLPVRHHCRLGSGRGFDGVDDLHLALQRHQLGLHILLHVTLESIRTLRPGEV